MAARLTDPCTFDLAGGARSGQLCGAEARFTVVNADDPDTDTRQRVCGRHIGQAIEQHSWGGAPGVQVLPDYHLSEPPDKAEQSS